MADWIELAKVMKGSAKENKCTNKALRGGFQQQPDIRPPPLPDCDAATHFTQSLIAGNSTPISLSIH